MPSIIEERDTALKSANDIVAAAKKDGRELTPEEAVEVKSHLDSFDAKAAQIEHGREVKNLTERLGATRQDEDTATSGEKARNLGEHFAKSGALEQFRKGTGQRSAASTEFKAATDPFLVGSNGQTQYGRVVETPLRRLTVADLLSQGTLSQSSLTYWTQGTVTGAPTAVAEGGLKPSINFAFSPVTETLAKIAAVTKVSDESIEDTDYLVSVINSQLVGRLQVVEEDQILNGNGTSPNLSGILDRSGIQTYTVPDGVGVTRNLDGILHGMTLVETGSSLLPVDGIVINPADYETLRLAKDANTQYFAGGPFTGAYGNDGLQLQPGIWGRRTVVTPAIAAGTVLVGSFAAGGQLFRKGGISVESTNSNENDFMYNRVAMRAEERLLLAIYFASAFCLVTLDA